MAVGQAVAPSLMDRYLAITGFRGQKTREAKPESAPDNLSGPIPGFARAQGDFTHKALKHSTYNWFAEKPWIGRTAALAGMTAAVWAMTRERAHRSCV
jgi:hypothetical protein